MSEQIQKLSNGISLYVSRHDECVAPPPRIKTNHVLVIDCSGSMSEDLPKMRAQLKNKLPSLVEPGDSVSLIWFSGRNEHGFVSEKVRVEDLTDLNNLNKAIDRWLNPIGLTGFVGPLLDAKKLLGDDGLYNMMFLTDGCDNISAVNDILGACRDMAGAFSSVAFVEYGWNCNHELLEQMAEEFGGAVIFAEDFEKYDPVFHSVMTSSVTKRKKVALPNDEFIGGIVFVPSENGAKSFKVLEDHTALLPEGINAVYGFLKTEGTHPLTEISTAYQGAALFVLKRNGMLVKSVLEGLGDYDNLRKYRNCFGKQNQLDFQTELVQISKNPSEHLAKVTKTDDGDSDLTVLDILDILSEGKNHLCLKELKYNRMSRQSSVKEESGISFHRDYSHERFPFFGLSWSEERPNISVLLKIPGHVNLPPNEFIKDPMFPTFVWRNYNLVRDGIVNIDILPMYLDKDTYGRLELSGIVSGGFDENRVYEINIRRLPMLSHTDMENVSIEDYFRFSLDVLKQKAEEKVYKAYLDDLGEVRKSEKFIEKYGEEATEWLKSLGITDFNGYSPKTALNESTDYYMGVKIITKMSGLSSLPSYNAFQKKASSGKQFTLSEKLLKPHVDECERIKAMFDINTPQGVDDFKAVIKARDVKVKKAMKDRIRDLSKLRFSLVVGQTWFDGFDPSDTNYELVDGGQSISCSVKIEDIQVKI